MGWTGNFDKYYIQFLKSNLLIDVKPKLLPNLRMYLHVSLGGSMQVAPPPPSGPGGARMSQRTRTTLALTDCTPNRRSSGRSSG